MRATKALWIFIGLIIVIVGSALLFIQSKTFASILKKVAQQHVPKELGLEGSFEALEVKFLPPGVVIEHPNLVFKEQNIAKLPEGTKLESESIDITFQFFQLLTGAVTVNALEIRGANLKLELEDSFFKPDEKKKKSVDGGFLSWKKIVKFSFRSVSLVDSKLDLTIKKKINNKKYRVQAIANEVTIGKLSTSGKPTYDLAIDFRDAIFDLPNFQKFVSQFRTSAELSLNQVQIRSFNVQDGNLSLHANGDLLGNLLSPTEIKSNLNYIVQGPAEEWLGKNLGGKLFELPKDLNLKGHMSLEGVLKADLMKFTDTLTTTLTGELKDFEIAGWKIKQSKLRGGIHESVVNLDSAEFQLGDGKVSFGAMKYDLNTKSTLIKTNVKFENADFRRLLGPEIKTIYPIHMIFNGESQLELKANPSDFNLIGSAKLRVSDFLFDNQKYNVIKPRKILLDIKKDISLSTGFKINKNGFFVDQAIATLGGTRLVARGEVTGAKGFNLDINGDVDLEDVGTIATSAIRGKGKLHWTITGKKPNVIFQFDAIDVYGAEYLNLDLGTVNGRITYDDGKEFLYFKNLGALQGRTEYIANGSIDVGDTDTIDIIVNAKKGAINDFSIVFANLLKSNVPWYPYDLSGQMKGLIRISGKTALDKLSVIGDMRLENLNYNLETFRGGTVRGGYHKGAYVAENINIKKNTGSIKGYLKYSEKDILDFKIYTEGFSSLDIDRLGILDIPFRAPLSISTKGLGRLGSLDSEFKLLIGNGVIRNRSVAATSVSLYTKAGRMMGDVSIFNGAGKGNFNIGWKEGSDSKFSFIAKNFNFAPILISLNPSLSTDLNLESDLSGAADLSFKTGKLSRLNGSIDLSSYFLRRTGFEIKLDRPLHLNMKEGEYHFESTAFSGTGTQLIVDGQVKNQKVLYNINGTLNLGIFEFFTDEIAKSKGSANIKAKIYGNADTPSAKGNITVNNSDLRLSSVEQPFERLSYNVLWEDSYFYVSDLSSNFAGGKVSGKGVIELFYYKPPTLDFELDLNNPKIKVFPVAYARTNGRLKIKGDKLPYFVTGDLHLPEALILENFDINERSRILRSSKFLPTTASGRSSDFQIFKLNVNIISNGGIHVRNELFDSELKGKINIINSVKAPRILGKVDIVKGKLLFKDSYFNIQSGDLKFNNPSAIDPEVNMIGQTDVRGYKIFLVVSGKVSNYKLTFQSQPPLSQKDIVNLLTIGVTSSDYQSIAKENRDAYSRDEVYNLLFSQSGIHKGIREKTGIRVRIGQSETFSTESAFTAKDPNLATTVSPKVEVQKEITKDLSISAGHTVGVAGGATKERNLGVEIRLPFKKTPILKDTSVIGVYEDQTGLQEKKTRNSTGIDLKFKTKFK